jgi:hypothetical protein
MVVSHHQTLLFDLNFLFPLLWPRLDNKSPPDRLPPRHLLVIHPLLASAVFGLKTMLKKMDKP